MTVTKDQIGMRGEANGACKLVATAGNATVIGAAITAASDDQTTRWFIKRDTGTGVVEITVDGGSTWQDVTTEVDSTAGFNECMESLAATANPATGIRVVTSGDAVHVGNDECHTAKIASEVAGSAPIFTAGATVSHAQVRMVYDIANHDNIIGAYYCEWQQFDADPSGICDVLATRNNFSNGRTVRYEPVSNRTQSRFNTGSVELAGMLSTSVNRFGVVYGQVEGTVRLTINDVDSPDTAGYTGYEVEVIRLNHGYDKPSLIRNVRRYEFPTYAENKDKIDELIE